MIVRVKYADFIIGILGRSMQKIVLLVLLYTFHICGQNSCSKILMTFHDDPILEVHILVRESRNVTKHAGWSNERTKAKNGYFCYFWHQNNISVLPKLIQQTPKFCMKEKTWIGIMFFLHFILSPSSMFCNTHCRHSMLRVSLTLLDRVSPRVILMWSVLSTTYCFTHEWVFDGGKNDDRQTDWYAFSFFSLHIFVSFSTQKAKCKHCRKKYAIFHSHLHLLDFKRSAFRPLSLSFFSM